MQRTLGYLAARIASKSPEERSGLRWRCRIFRGFNSRPNRRADLLLNHGVQKGEHLANRFLNRAGVIPHCERKIASAKKPRVRLFPRGLPQECGRKGAKSESGIERGSRSFVNTPFIRVLTASPMGFLLLAKRVPRGNYID